MSFIHSERINRLPSLRALYVFESAARHLNLVHAAAELGRTQGALSKQIRALERHIGVPLFVRTPRGLRFTEAGDVLWEHCQRAFGELHEALGTVSGARPQQSLVVAVARSYATRVLSHRVASFVERYPWIDLILDGHRYLCDLGRGEADVAIRVGDGKWSDALIEKIRIDPLFPVAAPALVHRTGTTDILALAKATSLLHFTERPYWDIWTKSTGLSLPRATRNVRFSETVMMLEAAEAGQGVAMARRSLVEEALREGSLVQLSTVEIDDGIAYFFCATPDALRREAVQRFREWLLTPFSPTEGSR